MYTLTHTSRGQCGGVLGGQSFCGVPYMPGFACKRPYLEGHGDLVSGSIIEMIGVMIWLNYRTLLTYLPHDPPSTS